MRSLGFSRTNFNKQQGLQIAAVFAAVFVAGSAALLAALPD